MTTIEPGWYQDPAEPATQRYWDGSAWVGKPVPADIEPPDRPEPVEPPPPTAEPATSDATEYPAPAGGFGPEGPPKIVQRTPGAVQPPDSVPIRSLGITVGWISNRDVSRILAGRVLAHPGARFVARLIDIICVFALNVVVNGYFVYQYWKHDLRPAFEEAMRGTPASEIDYQADAGLLWTIGFIALGLWFAYEVPSTLNTGQTLGKRVMGIKVASLAPMDLGWGRLLLRWSYAALPLICFPFGAVLWILDGIWCIRDRPFRQCLHDKSPGTAVVEVPREKEPAA
ncbi:RDD family protein [Glycomyces arizonensis]|uniref:RDD family protein n=1 Tax=Glycomyces arizonensis TaxID=256035 RepID=UPI000405489C|nr:RDD family protein [Glycomyces arizonensis]